MSFVYDYMSELASRDGSTVSELRKSLRPACITDAEAQSRGYRDAESYLADMHDWLNGQ